MFKQLGLWGILHLNCNVHLGQYSSNMRPCAKRGGEEHTNTNSVYEKNT